MEMARSIQSGRGRPSWLLFTSACSICFLVGTQMPNVVMFDQTRLKLNEEIVEMSPHALQLQCPECKPCDVQVADCNCSSISTPSNEKSGEDSNRVVFDWAVFADSKITNDSINKLCNMMIKSTTEGHGKNLGVETILFCYKHVLTYKRGYGYGWDNVNSSEMGFYSGVDLPPYQMDMFQYSAIHSVISSIPSKPIKDKLEMEGVGFHDSQSNYNQWEPEDGFPRGIFGPHVLFWGCGADTPMHALLVEFLGGNITFIDNNADFIQICKKSHHDISLIQPNGVNQEHTALIEKLVPADGSGLETDDVSDPLTETQWMQDLDGIETEIPWDVIVVDGPAENLGRSQPLYMAKRLAQSYGINHYTHIFLHDASRQANCVIANAIMGHHPGVFMGNTLPRKGLKHWRVAGRNRKLPPTKQNMV